MGITFLKIKVLNPANQKKFIESDFLVDSGAIYSVMPSSIPKKLGIEPDSKEEFTLANGEKIKKFVGTALFSYDGKKRGSPVIFGDEGIYLLGVVTLESHGLILDPINRELKKLPMVLM